MTQSDKYRAFATLHVPGDPVILFNVWDAGSAKAVAEAGAKAVATGSASVAGAHGFSDAEGLPIGMALATRNLMDSLRSAGEITGGPRPFSPKDRSAFLQSLDREIVRLKRQGFGSKG